MRRFALLVLVSTTPLLALALALHRGGRRRLSSCKCTMSSRPRQTSWRVLATRARKFWDKRPDGKPIPDVGGKPVKWLTKRSRPTISAPAGPLSDVATRAHRC